CVLAQVMVLALLISLRPDSGASVYVLSLTVNNERSGKGLQAYWEGVICKRKKLEVKRTHILGSLHLLNEAGQYNVDDLLSEGFSDPLLIDASSSTTKRTLDSTIQTSSKRTKVKSSNKDRSLESSEQHLQYSPHDTQNSGDDYIRPPSYNNTFSAESNECALDSLVESDIEVIEIDEEDEIKNLTEDEIEIRNKILKVLARCQDEEKKSKKSHMTSIYLNNIMDLTDIKIRKKVEKSLNEDQLLWFNKILKKQISNQTDEFKKYLNQFTGAVCNRAQIPTLVRKSFVSGRFDSYYYEDYDIAHQILEHCATRLEAPMSYESNGFNLERTFAIDTIIYILNRLFRMHQDVIDSGWIELTTPHTNRHKFDGLFKVLRTRQGNQVIAVVEFSGGRKASSTKENDDHVKLCRNSMRILNFILQTIPREMARIYLIQFVNSYLRIEYLIRPLPSVYLLDHFIFTKVPETFDDFENFAKDMVELMYWQADVLFTVKEINKIPYTAERNNVCTTPLEESPRKVKRKVIKKVNDSYSESTCPGSPLI
ncbi:15893_t:CDS:2, partial [Acaulospora morrowiae]